MNMNSEASAATLSQRAEAENTLQRYPAIDEHEAEALVLFLKKGPSVEVALLKSDEAYRTRIERFVAERPQDFDTKLRDRVVVVCLIVAFVVICYSLAGIGR